MARKSQKKQTRLAFATAATTAERSEADEERFRTLSYVHPTLPTVREERSRKSKPASPKKNTRSSKREKHPKLEESLENVPKIPRNESSQPPLQILGESSDDEIIVPSAQKRKRSAPSVEITQLPSKALGDSSEDEIIVPSAQKRKRSAVMVEIAGMSPEAEKLKDRKPRLRASSPAQPVEQVQTPRLRRKLKRKAESSPVINLDSDISEEPVMSSPVKRKRMTGPKTPEISRGSDDQDQLDIEEDVRDLQDSVVKRTRTRGRIPESTRDKRFKTLEAIRRKRLGLKPESEDDPEMGSDEVHEDSPSEQDSDNEENNSDVEPTDPNNEDLDRYEDDFVLDDDNVLLGVPTEEIPLEFTRHAYKKPKDYFRDVVGWMVLNRLDPAFPRSDAMYKMAFMKLEDEVKGRAGSQLISSVWNPAFRYSLLARPKIEISGYPTFDDHPCDACNRSGHPASSDMKLYGKPYSLETLEPLRDGDESNQSSSSDSDEESESSGVDRDREGHALPDENARFLLGKQCKARAQLAHTLIHWRFHLNEWVVDHLDRMGHMADSEVLRRNGLSQKRKTRNAIAVLDGMVTTGEVDKLYRDFHMNLKSARESQLE
ncbi:hypothetical protein N7520_009848 [Penicillium odoratum]|uniref:uncharacterized protein n=1 Tax=Penicillium odoratum TaxID=1167516 RepID=UPI002546D07C|nr:uncharacterized protein N7520_009848 [Penicillium odoratum]KAJ5752931.1 hypothetical protein N7520_009848 [Penicillium odoratum]